MLRVQAEIAVNEAVLRVFQIHLTLLLQVSLKHAQVVVTFDQSSLHFSS
jgi:hypothetical protein